MCREEEYYTKPYPPGEFCRQKCEHWVKEIKFKDGTGIPAHCGLRHNKKRCRAYQLHKFLVAEGYMLEAGQD